MCIRDSCASCGSARRAWSAARTRVVRSNRLPALLTGAPLWCRWLMYCRCTRGAAGSSPCSLDASTSTMSYARPGGTSGASAVLQPPTPQGCTSEQGRQPVAAHTLVRAADHARRADPQLAQIYYTQLVERGAEHLEGRLRRRRPPGRTAACGPGRGMPYVVCDTDGSPVDPATAKGDHRRALDRPARGPGPPAQPQARRRTAGDADTCLLYTSDAADEEDSV